MSRSSTLQRHSTQSEFNAQLIAKVASERIKAVIKSECQVRAKAGAKAVSDGMGDLAADRPAWWRWAYLGL